MFDFDITKIEGFEWDDGNREKNKSKHDVDMFECQQVFKNVPLVIIEDKKHSHAENRFIVFGKTNKDRKLTLVITIRDTSIRVISARDQHKKEVGVYLIYESNY